MLDPNYPQLVQSFVFLRRLADRLGVRVLVTVVPSKDEVHAPLLGRTRQTPTSFAQLVAPLAAGMGSDLLDLGPPLFAEAAARGDDGRLLYWRDDTHWNLDGHTVAARALLARLRELGVAPGAPARATK